VWRGPGKVVGGTGIEFVIFGAFVAEWRLADEHGTVAVTYVLWDRHDQSCRRVVAWLGVVRAEMLDRVGLTHILNRKCKHD
jgi:hypothetical protein